MYKYCLDNQIEQVDLVPTISDLLQLCLPLNTLGISFSNNVLSDENVMINAIKRNSELYQRTFGSKFDLSGKTTWYNLTRIIAVQHFCKEDDNGDFNVEKCREELQQVQSKILTSTSTYDVTYLGTGLVLMALVLMISVYYYSHDYFVMESSSLLSLSNLQYIFMVIPFLYLSSSFVEEEHEIW